MKRLLLLVPALGFGSAFLLQAAPITWGPATNTTGKSQLIAGNVVFAFSGGTAATITGGGASGTSTYAFSGGSYQSLTFSPAPGNRISADISNGAPSTGDASFDNVFKSFTDTQSGITSGTQTIGGLTNGTAYQIQVFFNDQRTNLTNRVMTYGDGAGNTVNLGAAGSRWGQHTVGSFTASGTTQSLTHASNGFGNVHVNAILVTQPGPPPAPAIPANLVATAGDAEITLDWDDNSQFGFANFIVRRAFTPGGPYSDLPGATPGISTYTDPGLTNGTTYYYVVAAKNTLDEVSANSNEASATPIVFLPDPPLVPSGLSVSPGNNRNTLNWEDNLQPGFLEFRVKRATVSGGPYSLIGSTANSLFLDLTALNGTTYYYVVTAVNIDLVESAPSDEREGTPSPTATPPNFVFIIADDMDTYSVNAYRNSEPVELRANGRPYRIATPHLDRLAAEGMLFHQARLMGADSGAVCRPSRTTIMSGKNTWQRTQGVSAPVTFPGIFNRGARAGAAALPYATYRTCKNGNSYPTANAEFAIVNDSTKRGNTNGNGSEWHGDRALEHLAHWQANHQPSGKPFLAYLGFSHPHDTRNARTNPNLTGRYGCLNTTSPGTVTLNANAPPLPLNHLPVNQALGIPANYPFHPFDHGHLNVRDEVNVPGILQYRTEAVVRNEIGRNFACVDWIDQQIGRVLAELNDPDGDGNPADSILDNTYIVFTSDHGIAIGRHGLQGKQNLYEHTWRVPYIVRGPGIAAGSETDALVYLHDTFPTFCDLAGIDLPATLDSNDGRSFRAVLEGARDSHREVHYGLYAGGAKPGMRAVTDGRFKLIKYDVGNNATQVTQMFDLQENPFELLPEHGVANLAERPAYAGIRQRLEELLMQQRLENADPYAFLGDRTLLRFEDGVAGQPAATLADRLPFGNAGSARSGTGGPLPLFTADVPSPADFVFGEPNTHSLDFEQDHQNYVEVADDRALDFGDNPFTIEAWVKLESLPTGEDAASRRPLVMKKVIGAGDTGLDYMFLAAAGSYGDAATFANLALLLGATPVVSTLSIPDTGWHQISVAFDPVSNTVRFTLDGQVDIRPTAASGTANNGPLIVGAHFNSAGVIDSAFDGLIDELSITDGFLSPGELQPLQNLPTPASFQITAITPDGSGSFDLTFESDQNFLYDLEQSATLEDGSWSKVRTFIAGTPGASSTTFHDIPVRDLDLSFYRVVCYGPAGL